ncbi:hypothetical protein IM543_00665 [Massilia sp. UMI-21]|nr:hypothetical protein IM543_00665 [Massilia sp. UMI-21]
MKLILIFAAMFLPTLVASATTLAEEALLRTPMAHEIFRGRGGVVQVHYVRLQGYLEGNPSNAIRLEQLKETVKACLRRRKTEGKPVRPPTTWPDFLQRSREDVYYATNRSIRYLTNIAYDVNQDDCSLYENVTQSADLVSMAGSCDVDLKAKNAKGYCPADGHASAPVTRAGPPVMADEVLKQMAADPRMATAVENIRKALKKLSTATGMKREVLGFECEMWDQPAAPGGGTACYTKAGSFVPSLGARNQGEAGMLVELDTKFGFKMKAVSVKTDTVVSSLVFVPYRQEGFTSTNSQRGRK